MVLYRWYYGGIARISTVGWENRYKLEFRKQYGIRREIENALQCSFHAIFFSNKPCPFHSHCCSLLVMALVITFGGALESSSNVTSARGRGFGLGFFNGRSFDSVESGTLFPKLRFFDFVSEIFGRCADEWIGAAAFWMVFEPLGTAGKPTLAKKIISAPFSVCIEPSGSFAFSRETPKISASDESCSGHRRSCCERNVSIDLEVNILACLLCACKIDSNK